MALSLFIKRKQSYDIFLSLSPVTPTEAAACMNGTDVYLPRLRLTPVCLTPAFTILPYCFIAQHVMSLFLLSPSRSQAQQRHQWAALESTNGQFPNFLLYQGKASAAVSQNRCSNQQGESVAFSDMERSREKMFQLLIRLQPLCISVFL